MGIAFFTLDGLFAPLQAALDWIGRAAQARPLNSRARGLARPALNVRSARPWVPAQRPGVGRLSAGPVRVLRLVDEQAPATAGRMVISGRMADVCAELDRMAGHEPPVRRSLGARRARNPAPRRHAH
jgi:hypothetical protein